MRWSWAAVEEVGLVIMNPRSAVRWDVPPEVVERWERRTAEQGITLDEYVTLLVQRAEEIENGET